MDNWILAALTGRDDTRACALTEKILTESRESDVWYEYFDSFAVLLRHPKSLVRNRALNLLAENLRWDADNRFDRILPEYLSHITDEKPITARQCVKALARVGAERPRYIPAIVTALETADLSGYRDSMRPLIEKDILRTRQILLQAGSEQ